jgi:DNA-binding response OmpR family regulator
MKPGLVGGKMKILLVDDEVEFVSALAERLSLRGIDAEWVSRPEDAVSRVEQSHYDLAVLDVKMPRLSGIGLKVILQEKCPDMKFIFLTGHGSEESYEAGSAEAGEAYYLMKPLKLKDLILKIDEVVKG